MLSQPLLCLQEELKRNIHLKRFQDVPLADLEMIFPDKKVYLKPLLLIQLFIGSLGGVVSVLVTFLTVSPFLLSDHALPLFGAAYLPNCGRCSDPAFQLVLPNLANDSPMTITKLVMNILRAALQLTHAYRG